MLRAVKIDWTAESPAVLSIRRGFWTDHLESAAAISALAIPNTATRGVNVGTVIGVDRADCRHSRRLDFLVMKHFALFHFVVHSVPQSLQM